LNLTIIKGRLTRDPELRHTSSGIPVAGFTVAVDREYVKEGADKAADFFDCVAWQKRAEAIAKHFAKGKEILLRGRMESRDWIDQQGNKRRSWELQVDHFEFCGPKSAGEKLSEASESLPPVTGNGFEEFDDDDDLPF